MNRYFNLFININYEYLIIYSNSIDLDFLNYYNSTQCNDILFDKQM